MSLWYAYVKGFWRTLSYIFRTKVTKRYPLERTQQGIYFRGEHALRKDASGDELCVGCKLCEAVCPAHAITIRSGRRDDGRRIAEEYTIDMLKCIYCGLCEKACPVDAICEGPNYEYASLERGSLTYTKDILLRNGDKWAKLLEERVQKRHE